MGNRNAELNMYVLLIMFIYQSQTSAKDGENNLDSRLEVVCIHEGV